MGDLQSLYFIDMTNHPITPPPELQEEWLGLWPQDALLQAARWGADQELEACCDWLIDNQPKWATTLCAARRPKAKSLAEEALEALTKIEDNVATYLDSSVVRRALERLQELEGQADG
jgi:hypothetical protein